MTLESQTLWHALSPESTLQKLETDMATGLSETEALSRLEKFGPNKLKGKKKKNFLQLFIAQLRDWLIYVLFVAVLITLFMGEYIDAVIILMVIVVNALLGVIQEVKAGKAIEALQKMTSPKVLVKRDGVVKEIESERIVPGDILLLDAGRFVAADLRLLESANLQIEESALTGESVPSVKEAGIEHTEPNTPLGDRTNSAFMSTLVTYGRGIGVAVATGMQTEVGKIATMLDSGSDSKTPLEVRLDELGKTLGKMAIGVCLFIFVVALFQGRNLSEMFLTSVSLAVAAIPEGLAAIVAVVLSIGVTVMSRQNAIIKRLPAVETLGSVNIICSDKTGTLTQNKMTVTKYFSLNGEKEVLKGAEPEKESAALLLAKAMILCSDATYDGGKGTGDPTEIALLVLGDDLGLDRKGLNRESQRVGEFAFDSDRKLMSTLVEEKGTYTVYTKGAIDNLLAISTHILENGKVVPLTDEHRSQFNAATEAMSDQALRTLGAAYKPTERVIEASEMENNLILIGFVGMIDPPRTEVKESVSLAQRAGITTIMITGDHKNTALAIARELGIAQHLGQAITGAEIDTLTDAQFSENISQYRVFARVSPSHKVKIVHALKSHGNIVSMTGDGVNDAPSLHAADIGVAMGITGTDVAKGASDMILTDDNFATIVTAIEQGRNIYSNIKKSVLFLLTCNLGEIVAMFFTLLIGWESPLIATQLLWINLLTDSFPAIALGMDPGDPDVMRAKPRNPKESFFAGGAGKHALFGGVLIGLLTILAFYIGFVERGYSPFDNSIPEEVIAYARTMAFMVLISCQLFFALAMRNPTKSIFTIGLFSNRYLMGAIVAGLGLQWVLLAIPVLRDAFHLQVLHPESVAITILLGMIPLFANELFKVWVRARK